MWVLGLIGLFGATLLSTSNAEPLKQVLSFGGNGMIGTAVMKKLFAEGGYNINLVSRGHWYFNTSTEVQPFVNHIFCDRSACMDEEDDCDNALEECPELVELVKSTEKFDYVLDFSGYSPFWVRDAEEFLQKKVGVYVYISTDSIYDVCEVSENSIKTKESEAVRPTDEELALEMNENQSYGDEKLMCEEYLDMQRKDGGFPWVALRFADVIGPLDGSYRWSNYQLWLTLYHDLELPINNPSDIKDKLESLTYVEDAAESVLLSMKTPSAWDAAYNIAMEETYKLWDIVDAMAKTLGVENIAQVDEEDDPTFYPSVLHGPIDITEAKEKLGFVPTKPEVAFKATAEWTANAFLYDEEERLAQIANFVASGVFPEGHEDVIYEALNNYLGKYNMSFDLDDEDFEGMEEEYDDDDDQEL